MLSKHRFVFLVIADAAGCDDLDSDGDRLKDRCEDRYPPELVIRNAEIFRCDDDDVSRLCYTERVFKSEKQVSAVLRVVKNNYQHFDRMSKEMSTWAP